MKARSAQEVSRSAQEVSRSAQEVLMVVCVTTVALCGFRVNKISIEVHLSNGLPSFHIVGLPDKTVSEAKERVRSVLSSIGLAFPSKRVVVNLSPADLPKTGSHYDLPIALGMLQSMGVLDEDSLSNFVCIGELGLGGDIKPVRCAILAASFCNDAGYDLICPQENSKQARFAFADGTVLAPSYITELVNYLKGNSPPPLQDVPVQVSPKTASTSFMHVRGQALAKRALLIASCGQHNMLMKGPPGVGKSLLASCLPDLLCSPSKKDMIDISALHQMAELIPPCQIISTRPFRSPHHTASSAAMIGGGHKALPGEASLAHKGVLFLDELPEFAAAVLDTLRQPIETRRVLIARANAHIEYPADFLLIAAMNLCRCYGPCTSFVCRQKYQKRIPGPILDRFDLCVALPYVKAGDLAAPPDQAGFDQAMAQLEAGRTAQEARAKEVGTNFNSRLSVQMLEKYAKLGSKEMKLLEDYMERYPASGRSYHQVLRVARTIADMELAEHIGYVHLAEALGYRMHNIT